MIKRPYSDLVELAHTVGGDNIKLSNRVLVTEIAKILKDMEARIDQIEEKIDLETGNQGGSQPSG